jgi:PadR family transcriptional regulator PadR
MYGWQLSDTLVKYNLIASIGTLYPMLARLRTQGLVSTFDETSNSGPVRKYYRLTLAGTGQLRAFRRQWDSFAQTVHTIVGEGEKHDQVNNGR